MQSTYWSTEEEFVKSSFSSFAGTSEDAVIQLESVLSRAVSSQMESDVPLGAFLSGGVDSSLIVALMQSQSSKKINTKEIKMIKEINYDIFCYLNDNKQIALTKKNKTSFLKNFHLPEIKEAKKKLKDKR